MFEAMEQAAIVGLCRDGQLEIAVQAVRRARPDLDAEQLLVRAKVIYARAREDFYPGRRVAELNPRAKP